MSVSLHHLKNSYDVTLFITVWIILTNTHELLIIMVTVYYLAATMDYFGPEQKHQGGRGGR